MGVAVRASTSTEARSCFIRSLWATPNRCSSSMTIRPRFLNVTSFDKSRCVPITTSTVPCRRPSTTAFCSLGERKRDSSSTLAGNGAKRLLHALPGRAPQAVEPRGVGVRAEVFRDAIQTLDRQVEAVGLGVLEQQKVPFAIADLHRL